MNRSCGHLDQVRDVTPSSEGCEDCLRIGGRWVHLRMCMSCGHVGCCDNSPNRHATAHFRCAAPPDHPVLRAGRGLVVLLRRRPRLRRRRRTVVRPPMSAGPATALGDTQVGSPQIAGSAVVIGAARLGEGSLLAEGAVIRSDDAAVEIGTGSAVLENSVVVGTRTIPTTIGRRTTFGHRCIVIGATVGDLCEIGNASKLMPGAHLGDRVFLGEGTVVPAGMTLPSDVVAVGRPGPGRPHGVGRRPRPPPRLARRGPVDPAADRHHRRRHPGDDHHGPALRVSRHRADHRRVGGPVPDRRDHRRRRRRRTHDHRRRRQDHRRLPRPGAHRQRRPDPREHCPAPAPRQRPDHRRRRDRRSRGDDPRLSHRRPLRHRTRRHRL